MGERGSALLAAILLTTVTTAGVSREAYGQIAPASDSRTNERAANGIYVVDDYDPARDPTPDVRAAVERAQAEHKRILIEVGGQWCGWCKILDRFVKETPAVHDLLAAHYLIVKVNFSRENENAGFLSQYPPILGYPHIFVLDSDGTFLHSQDTAELEEGRGYNESAVVAFLKDWVKEATSSP